MNDTLTARTFPLSRSVDSGAMDSAAELAAQLYQGMRSDPGPDSPEEVGAWAEDVLARWREISDRRFGAVCCIEWAPRQHFCKTLGYSFEGRHYPIRHLRDRLDHQQEAWNRLVERLLGLLRAAPQAGPAEAALRLMIWPSREPEPRLGQDAFREPAGVPAAPLRARPWHGGPGRLRSGQ